MPKKQPKPLAREQISLWVMQDDVARADALTARLAADRRSAGMGRISRSLVMRLALTHGLDALEREYK